MILVNNRDSLEWFKGMTVQDVLDRMGYSYTLITVTVNGDLINKEDYSYQIVPDDASVSVFHLAHGG
jgi:thiamine biosynthesis protein ThiS